MVLEVAEQCFLLQAKQPPEPPPKGDQALPAVPARPDATKKVSANVLVVSEKKTNRRRGWEGEVRKKVKGVEA